MADSGERIRRLSPEEVRAYEIVLDGLTYPQQRTVRDVIQRFREANRD